jgi:hypothetical protein
VGKAAIGYVLIAIPFWVILAFAVAELGWVGTLIGLAVLGLLVGCVTLGVKLICE